MTFSLFYPYLMIFCFVKSAAFFLFLGKIFCNKLDKLIKKSKPVKGFILFFFFAILFSIFPFT